MYSVVVGVFLPSDATDSIFGRLTIELLRMHAYTYCKYGNPNHQHPEQLKSTKLKILKSYDRHETERPELLEKRKAAR